MTVIILRSEPPFHHHHGISGKYSADLVKTVGENQYLINLVIRDVSQADGETENFLLVTVNEKNFTVPIIVETQKEWGEVTQITHKTSSTVS